MNIEQAVKDVITTKLQEGIIEKLVAENLEKGINNSLEKLLGSYGDVTKVIQDKIKEVMISQLSGYDYSKYVVKLDAVLTEILQHTALDHKKILENFKDLMIEQDIPDKIKVSDLFEEFKKYVADSVDTSKLEVNTDDEPCYEYVDVTMEVEHEEKRSWSSFKNATIIFECEKDEKLNTAIKISKFENYPWRFDDKIDSSIESLRHMNHFTLYLLKLHQKGTTIEIDKEYLDDEVKPEAEPEASFS